MQKKHLTEFFKNSFSGYCRYAQKSIEPTWNYDEKFYKKVIADLTVFLREDSKEDLLLEEAPPRTGKTELTTHLGLTWLLTKYTNKRFLVCAGNQNLKRKLRRGILRIINSQFYQEYFNLKCEINNSTEMLMSNGNLVFFTTTSSAVPTGEGFHFMFFEDYLTKTMIDSQAKLENAYDQLDGLLSRTQDDPQTKIIINNQRLALNDLSDRITSSYNEMGVKYQRLTFPYQFEEYTEYLLPNNEKISFTEGEFLVSRFNEDKKNKIIARVGRNIFETQYQQKPSIISEGALFTRENIKNAIEHSEHGLSIEEIRNMLDYVVIGVDPAVSTGELSDKTGIVVCGYSVQQKMFYVLEDQTGKHTPHQWASQVSYLYDKWKANYVVAEGNQGGNLIKDNLLSLGTSMYIDTVHARFGKITRAEPIAALYQQNKVKHIRYYDYNKEKRQNHLDILEHQMTTYSPFSKHIKSPDNMDAMVWAMTKLVPMQKRPMLTVNDNWERLIF
jgi:phage terminase large subunit-like protein